MNETVLLAADAMAPIERIPVEPVFSDMDTCYNCMYLFGSKPELEQRASLTALPEVDTVLQEEERSIPERDLPSQFLYGRGGSPDPVPSEGAAKGGELFSQFLVELHGFLGKFLLDRALFGELAAMGAIADQQFCPQRLFSLFDDAPGFTVGHAHGFGCCIQGSSVTDALAEGGYPGPEDRSALGLRVRNGDPDIGFQLIQVLHDASLSIASG